MAYSNPAARLGAGTNNLAQGGEYPLTRISNDYMLMLSLYRGSWITRKVVDVLAEDMLKDFPVLSSELDPGSIKDFNKVVSRTATEAKMLEALKWGRLFGGGVAVIVIDGVEDLSEPLVLDEILPGSYKGLIALDRWSGVYPSSEMVTDINYLPEFGLPKYYECQFDDSKLTRINVHHTRILRFMGRELPNWERQSQMYWGISEIELIFDELRKRDYTSWNIVSLLTRAQIMAIKEPQLAQALSGIGMTSKSLETYLAKIQAISDSMNNQGLLALPEEGELFNTSYSFGGLADIYNMFLLDVAGACETPVSRLFGRTVTGLGQSGEGDLQVYYDSVEQKRKRELRPQMDKLIPVIAMSTFGRLPDDLDFTFPPIRSVSDKDRADLAKTNTDAVTVAFNAGLTSQKTSLKELKQQSETTGLFSNITDEDIEKANDEPEPMGEMDGGAEDPMSMPQPKAGSSQGGASDSLRRSQSGDMALDADAFEDHTFHGIPVTVEYRKGTVRTIRNPRGKVVYQKLLQHDYGFIRKTIGRDGDEIDVILGPNQASTRVFIVDMQDLGPDVDKREDEDKVLLGFYSSQEAKRAFLSMYPATFLRTMVMLPIRQFRNDLIRNRQAKSLIVDDAEWEENEHPRAGAGSEKGGQFVGKGQGGGRTAPGNAGGEVGGGKLAHLERAKAALLRGRKEAENSGQQLPPAAKPQEAVKPAPSSVSGGKLAHLERVKAALLRVRKEAEAVKPAPSSVELVHGSVAQKLSSGAVTSTMAMAKGGVSSGLKLVHLENGQKAVFKPSDGEAPGQQTNISDGYSIEREVGAWTVASLVGMDDMVVPSVKRTIGGKEGALLGFAEGLVAGLAGAEMYDGTEDCARAAAFDFVIGNEDRHGGNWIMDNGKMRLIDHGLSFPDEGPYVGANEWILDHARAREGGEKRQQKSPDKLAAVYVKAKPQILDALAKVGLPKASIAGVSKRIDILAQTNKWRNVK